MIAFYTWPSNVRLFITFFFAVCVLFQTGALVFSRYRYPKTGLHRAECGLELAILLQILCLSLLHGQVYMGFDMGFVAPMGYAPLRIAGFACVMVSSGLVSMMSRKVWPLLPVLSALVLLPAVEPLTGSGYPAFYMLSLVFLLMRSIRLCVTRYGEIKAGISALSIKSAIDNLHTGILFSREDGRILLMSSRMQALMTQIAGEVFRNGNLFYDRLCSGAYDNVCSRAELDKQVVCLFPDGSAWMFARTAINIKDKSYTQLTASDVTQRYQLTAALRAQDEALQVRSEELKQTIANLQEISRDRETQKAKMRAHDVLGQRLTLLLRMVRGEQALDIETLKTISDGLLRELSVGTDPPPPGDALENLRQIFGSIGVDVQVDGSLPHDEEQARIFVDVIREGVVNAVRHGFATKVEIQSRHAEGLWRLQIQNNGHPPAQPMVEGGGIGSMREKLTQSGGTLQVTEAPRFSLSATLPGGAG